MKVMGIVNQKGGVAKTTTAQALAFGLNAKGYKVLMIDFDAQGSLTTSCGLTVTQEMSTAFEFLNLSVKLKDDFKNIVVNLREGLDIIPSDIRLEEANVALAGKPMRELYLSKAISSIASENYDYVIIDTNPSLSLLTFNVLCAVDEIIIPFKPEYQSVQGVRLLIQTINELKVLSDIKINGFLITIADLRRNSTKEAINYLHEFANSIGTKVYKSVIRQITAVADAPSAGKSIFEFRPQAAQDYLNFVEEFLTGGNK